MLQHMIMELQERVKGFDNYERTETDTSSYLLKYDFSLLQFNLQRSSVLKTLPCLSQTEIKSYRES